MKLPFRTRKHKVARLKELINAGYTIELERLQFDFSLKVINVWLGYGTEYWLLSRTDKDFGIVDSFSRIDGSYLILQNGQPLTKSKRLRELGFTVERVLIR